MWQKLLKLSGNQKQPAVSQPYDQSVAIWPQITTPVWPTPENLYDAKSAILTMSKKFVTFSRIRPMFTRYRIGTHYRDVKLQCSLRNMNKS
jgi:hypothetical protein